ncbi:hypothetical protein [Sandarakinorhabdus oryzae]|uniref:hypothetical protein n=1 Tax=Sandarakinorhabdus oryzae TaxID=2675220 RepID=UPI0012E20D7E|nr:hypothetical protein [Sandarakinorhabdus oryzae]
MISIRSLALVVAALAASSALAGPLVVRAAGPSSAQFKPGQRLPDAPVTLKAGDSIVVLDAKGTRSFSGPGTFSLTAASAQAEQVAFSDLLVQKPARRARIGAVRATGQDQGPPSPPGVWALDTRQSDTVCVLDPANIALWRADTSAAQSMTITRDDGATATLNFGIGQALAPLPAAVAGKPGALKISGGKSPVTLTVKQVAAPGDVEALGATLVEAGCQSQFQRLAVNTLQD